MRRTLLFALVLLAGSILNGQHACPREGTCYQGGSCASVYIQGMEIAADGFHECMNQSIWTLGLYATCQAERDRVENIVANEFFACQD